MKHRIVASCDPYNASKGIASLQATYQSDLQAGNCPRESLDAKQRII